MLSNLKNTVLLHRSGFFEIDQSPQRFFHSLTGGDTPLAIVIIMKEQPSFLSPLRLGLSLGTFLSVAFLGCLAFSFLVTDRSLHQPWLQFFLGFSWTPPGILLGLVQAFVYGLLSGIIFAPIYNAYGRRGL